MLRKNICSYPDNDQFGILRRLLDLGSYSNFRLRSIDRKAVYLGRVPNTKNVCSYPANDQFGILRSLLNLVSYFDFRLGWIYMKAGYLGRRPITRELYVQPQREYVRKRKIFGTLRKFHTAFAKRDGSGNKLFNHDWSSKLYLKGLFVYTNCVRK